MRAAATDTRLVMSTFPRRREFIDDITTLVLMTSRGMFQKTEQALAIATYHVDFPHEVDAILEKATTHHRRTAVMLGLVWSLSPAKMAAFSRMFEIPYYASRGDFISVFRIVITHGRAKHVRFYLEHLSLAEEYFDDILYEISNIKSAEKARTVFDAIVARRPPVRSMLASILLYDRYDVLKLYDMNNVNTWKRLLATAMMWLDPEWDGRFSRRIYTSDELQGIRKMEYLARKCEFTPKSAHEFIAEYFRNFSKFTASWFMLRILPSFDFQRMLEDIRNMESNAIIYFGRYALQMLEYAEYKVCDGSVMRLLLSWSPKHHGQWSTRIRGCIRALECAAYAGKLRLPPYLRHHLYRLIASQEAPSPPHT